MPTMGRVPASVAASAAAGADAVATITSAANAATARCNYASST
jgi:hypothetical protein